MVKKYQEQPTLFLTITWMENATFEKCTKRQSSWCSFNQVKDEPYTYQKSLSSSCGGIAEARFW